MKNKGKFIVVISLVFLLLSVPLFQARSPSKDSGTGSIFVANSTSRQNGNLLAKLQWYAPSGVLPGTYAEYLKTHPLTHARFTTPTALNAGLLTNYSLAILVNTTLYPLIEISLDQYLADLDME
jgi:hypothetical protein